MEASKGGDVALWRDMMGVQLKMVSPSTLDKLLALNTESNALIASELYQTFIYTLGADIALRLQAKKAQGNAQAAPAAKIASRVDQTFTLEPHLTSRGTFLAEFPLPFCHSGLEPKSLGAPFGANRTPHIASDP